MALTRVSYVRKFLPNTSFKSVATSDRHLAGSLLCDRNCSAPLFTKMEIQPSSIFVDRGMSRDGMRRSVIAPYAELLARPPLSLATPQRPLQKLDDSLALKRLLLIIATIAINIVAVAVLTWAPWSDWKTGLALNVVDNAMLLWFVVKHGDILLGRLMIFGLGVGFTELAADAWLVDYTKTLDYSIGGGPMLWRSPLWMPFAWEVVAVQFGYVGLWLWNRFCGWGLLGVGLLGAINIPYYEEMARRINWWQYDNCRMFSQTPYYIILGEFGIAILLAILAKHVTRGNWMTSIIAGTIGGLGIFVCYALAYGITDGITLP